MTKNTPHSTLKRQWHCLPFIKGLTRRQCSCWQSFVVMEYFSLPDVWGGGENLLVYQVEKMQIRYIKHISANDKKWFFFSNFIYKTITYTTYSTNILLTYILTIHKLQCNHTYLIRMLFSIIERLHVNIQVTKMLHFF